MALKMPPHKSDIMRSDLLRHHDAIKKRAETGAKTSFLFVGDRRFQPFYHHGVSLERKPQRLSEIPTAGIDIANDRELDDIARRNKSKMMLDGTDVDKATIIIAVGRWKAPGAATTFDRKTDADALFAHRGKPRPVLCDGFGIEAVDSAIGMHADQTRRSTIIFLISAIALAGLRPFGQVCAQFMIVWQR